MSINLSSAQEQRAEETREAETRTMTARELQERFKAFEYELLPNPPAPIGNYTYRWVRVRIGNEEDTRNIAVSFQQGYEPVKPEEIPGFHAPTLKHGTFNGYIGIEGLVLCKIDKDLAERHQKHALEMAGKLELAVRQNLFRVQDARMPIRQESSEEVTRGRRAIFRDDD